MLNWVNFKNGIKKVYIIFSIFIIIFANSLFGLQDTNKDVNNIDLLILIDDSRSMDMLDPTNHRIKSTQYCLDILNQYTTNNQKHRLGIIRFGTDVTLALPLTPLENVTLQEIPTIEKKNFTDFGGALKLAYDEFDDKDSFKEKHNTQIILITDGVIKESTEEFIKFRDDVSEMNRLRNVLFERFDKWIDKLGNRGCTFNAIIAEGKEEDKDTWKKKVHSTEGLYYSVIKDSITSDLKKDCEKILSKALNLYQINLINPKLEQTERDTIYIKVNLLRNNVIQNNPELVIQSDVKNAIDTLISLVLTCDEDGFFSSDNFGTIEKGDYTICIKIKDRENIILKNNYHIKIKGLNSFSKLLKKFQENYWILLIGIILTIISFLIIYVFIFRFYFSKKNKLIRKYEKEANRLINEGDNKFKKGKYKDANIKYFEAGEEISKLEEIYNVQVTDDYTKSFKKLYLSWITEMKDQDKNEFSERLDFKRKCFKNLLIKFCKEKKEIGNREGIAKMLSDVVIEYHNENMLENIRAILSLRGTYNNIDNHIIDIFQFTESYLSNIQDEYQGKKDMHERIDDAKNLYKVYHLLLDIDEKGVYTDLSKAVDILNVIRNKCEPIKQIYEYYLDIFETFKPVLDKKWTHKIYLTTIREYLINNTYIWERYKT